MDFIQTLTSFDIRLFGTIILYLSTFASFFLVWHTARLPSEPKTKKIIFTLCGLLWLVTISAGWHIATMLPTVPAVLSSTPKKGGDFDLKNPKIIVSFSAPVVYKSLTVHTFPETEMTVKPAGILRKYFPFGTKVEIIPKSSLIQGEQYMVYLSNIEGPLTQGYGGEELMEITNPNVEITGIEPSDNTSAVNPMQTFTVTLSQAIVSDEEWLVKMDPPHPMSVHKTDVQTLEVKPIDPLQQSTAYTMTILHVPIILDQETKQEMQKLEPRTKGTYHYLVTSPAFISSFAPLGTGVNPIDDFRIKFEKPMDHESVLSNITFDPPIEIKNTTWEDNDMTLTIHHDSLPKDQKYTATLKKGLRNIEGGLLESDVSFHFHTAGPLTLTQSSPHDGETNTPLKQVVRLTFDQDINSSITDKLTIDPNVPGKTTLGNREIIFTPETQLSSDTKYTIKLARDARSTHGLPSTQDYTVTFTTQTNQVNLAIPIYRQGSQFTCNIAALRMMLAYRGVTVSEQDLINKIGSGGKRGSGNPYKGYIDDYGTYWDAILRGATAYRPARIIKSGNLTEILSEVKKGNPIMTWGQNGWSDPHDISWTATDGTSIRAINGMHSAVVHGYKGPDDNPTHIFINDPWRGQYTLETAEFMRRWKYFSVAMALD